MSAREKLTMTYHVPHSIAWFWRNSIWLIYISIFLVQYYRFKNDNFLLLQVHSILLPIYLNPNNEYSLRCVAYLGTMKTQPSYGTLQTIVHSLHEEQSQQVGEFVYSHLHDTADSSRLSLNRT